MKGVIGAIAAAAAVASLAGYFAAAMADGYWRHHRASKMRTYRPQLYRSAPRYYNSGPSAITTRPAPMATASVYALSQSVRAAAYGGIVIRPVRDEPPESVGLQEQATA